MRVPPVRSERLSLYAEADAAAHGLAEATGLRCPDECARCCDSPRVHVSVADMIPIAEEALVAGQAEALWAASEAAEGRPCVLLEATGPGRGRCSVYPLRPMLCRLFGFAAIRDKLGRPQLSLCIVHAETQPEVSLRARALVEAGCPAPGFVERQQQVDALDPSSATPQLPINRALRLALERVMVRARYGSGDQAP